MLARPAARSDGNTVRKETALFGRAPIVRAPFVGRQQELTRLARRLVLAGQGDGGVVLVAGEPGIGKTRLVAELAHQAGADGWLVLVGRAYDAEAAPPYRPIVEALRDYVHACPLDELRAQLADGAPDVAVLVREVRGRLPDLVPSTPLSPEHERYRLFDSIAAFLLNAARSRPDGRGLLLVLDDLHLTDKPTLLLLQHLARHLTGAPLLVAGTYPTVDLPRAHPLRDLLADLSREHLYDSVVLKPLPVEEAARLIQELSGGPAAPAVVEGIYRETEGSPFFVEELVRHLRAEGYDLADPRSLAARWAIPEGVRHVVARRLARLSPAANQLLQVAALLGDGFGFDALAAARQVEQGPLVDALEEVLGAGVLREEEERYYFAHGLLRQTLHAEMSPPRRAHLHRQAAEPLERLYAANPEPHLAELAHHFYAAARPEDLAKTIGYARRAGDRALQLLAYEEGARLYELGLKALDRADAADEARRCELLLALGEARRRAGELEQAMEVFRRAADVARRVGAPELLARAASGYEDALLPTGVPRMRSDDPSALLQEEALGALPVTDGALRARLLAGLGRALYFAGARARAAALIDEAVGMARRVADTSALAYALHARCMAVWASGDLEQRLATATELTRLAAAVGDRELELEGRGWRLIASLERGDVAAVDAEIETYARLAAELRQPQYLGDVAMWRAMRALMDGRLAEVESLAREARAAGRRAQRQESELVFTHQMLDLHCERGDLAGVAETEPTIREIAARYRSVPTWRAFLAATQSVLDRPDAARAEFEQLAANDFADLPHDLSWLAEIAVLAQTCAYLGDARRAAALYGILRPYDGRVIVASHGDTCQGPVAHYLGVLATTLGRWEDALAHFAAAEAIEARLGARPALARTREAHATALLSRRRREDLPRARELLEGALAVYRELGIERGAARARARLGEPRLTARAAPAYPAGLTQREVEVLRLIAGGRSNQAIAEELVLSERTVERHITNLYRKIDARGRADATAYALTHRLAEPRPT
ncbi:MAG TPA: AAA family ATPase [Chloroflexota bacterium]|jgi:DNA-binding CsgD family transcriptional regulator|nr:AAA family ATPase [Chloroflexota bacterium]